MHRDHKEISYFISLRISIIAIYITITIFHIMKLGNWVFFNTVVHLLLWADRRMIQLLINKQYTRELFLQFTMEFFYEITRFWIETVFSQFWYFIWLNQVPDLIMIWKCKQVGEQKKEDYFHLFFNPLTVPKTNISC